MTDKELKEMKNWLKELNSAIKYKFLRESIAKTWFGDYDSLSARDILRKLKERKIRLLEEINYSIAISDYHTILNELVSNEKITIYCFADYVYDDKKIDFISPFLLKNIDFSEELKELNLKLKAVNRLHCQIKDRRPEKFRVFYSGDIVDENNSVIVSFSEIDNGFAVRLG